MAEPLDGEHVMREASAQGLDFATVGHEHSPVKISICATQADQIPLEIVERLAKLPVLLMEIREALRVTERHCGIGILRAEVLKRYTGFS